MLAAGARTARVLPVETQKSAKVVDAVGEKLGTLQDQAKPELRDRARSGARRTASPSGL